MLSVKEQEYYYNLINEKFKYLFLEDCYDRTDHPDGWSDSSEEYWEEEDYWIYIKDKVGASRVAYGASKVVFWFDEISDYVVKIPIVGKYEDYSEEFVFFENAQIDDIPSHHDNNDYCGLEADISSFIQESYPLLAHFFALTFYIGTSSHGINIYLSEKAEDPLTYHETINTSDNGKALAYEALNIYQKNLGGIAEYALALFFDKYAEDEVEELIDFIGYYHIDDLHSGNIAFNDDGNIVIVDFAGFDY